MSGMTPPHLTPAALFEKQTRLDELRLQTYNRILAAAHQKIRHASRLPNSDQTTCYEVPEWQMGCPRYDIKDCILYLVWNLRNSGFRVLYVSPNRLLISWKEQSVQYYTEESPIRQAMLAAAQKKETPIVAAAGEAPSSKPEKKKASSYRPMAEGVAGMLSKGSSKGRADGVRVTFI
jgi:hypothetical protein